MINEEKCFKKLELNLQPITYPEPTGDEVDMVKWPYP